jgi:nucleoside-diphosphate-sugar epimerase
MASDLKDDPRTVCVTGATGFVGKHLVKRLEQENVLKLKLLTRRPPDGEVSSQKTHYVQGDLLDYESLKDFPEEGSVVIHLAYLFGRSREENLAAIRSLCRACRERRIFRFVHLSSTGVIGDTSDPIVTESTPCQPDSEYELTKLDSESILIQELSEHCDVAILRPTCIFGSGGDKVVKLVEEIVSDSSLVRYLKKSLFQGRRLNLVCAENVVEALWFLSTRKDDFRGEPFIVSDDEVPDNNYTYVSNYLAGELAVPLSRWPPLPLAASFLPIALKLLGRGHKNPHKIYSSERLEALGYQKAIGFQEGLKRFAEWYRLEMTRTAE